MTRRRGFTLLELLLALSITVVIAGSLGAAIYTAFRASTAAERAVKTTRASDLAVDIIAGDLTNAVPPSGTLAGAFTGAADTVTFFTTGTESRATISGDMKRIDLLMDSANSGGTMTLIRRVTTNLLAPAQVQPPDEIVCRNVTTFSLSYFDGSNYLDTWDSTQHGDALPLAVQVTLELAPARAGDEPRRTVRLFALPCAQVDATAVNLGGGM